MLLLLWIAACSGDVSTAPTKTDADGDGYTAEVDCDDSQALVNPDAPEKCDDLDNDCNGVIDDAPIDLLTVYADTDGDGYGDPATSLETCVAPVGVVTDATDCNDADAAINPAATELCDPQHTDEDCNGLADDADPSTTGKTTYYADTDGDQYGDSSQSSTACVAPAGFGTDATDCNDADAAINPAATELCDPQHSDEDCDGLADDDDPSTTGKTTYYADTDGDQYGDSSQSSTACVAPAGFGTDATDCNDADAAINPAATEICDPQHSDEDCNGLADDDDPSTTGKTTYYADTDGDQYGDASQSSPACVAPAGFGTDATDCNDADAAIHPAATEVCDPQHSDEDCDGLADDDDPSTTGKSTYYADTDGDQYGDSSQSSTTCVAPAGFGTDATDCNDADAAIHPAATEVCADGIDNNCSGTADEGCVHHSWLGDYSTADYDSKIYGDTSLDQFGYSIAAGDFNNDGLVDLAVGAPNDEYSATYTNYGVTYVYYGPLSTGVDLSTATDDALLYSTLSTLSDFGQALWAFPDMNGDGLDELMVGADRNTYNWAVLAFRGSALSGDVPNTATYHSAWDCNDMSEAGNFYSASAGYVACGDPSVGTAAGVVKVFRDSSSSAYVTMTGEDVADYAGESVDVGHDLDGDGTHDALVGAYAHDLSGSVSGAAYVIYGPVSGTLSLAAADVKITGISSGDSLGYQVAAADMNDDGVDEAFLGAYGDDAAGRSAAGAVYVFGYRSSGTYLASTCDWSIYGESVDDNLGRRPLTFGDVDGNGVADLLVSSNSDDGGAVNAGAAWLIYGPTTTSLDLSVDYDVVWRGDGRSYYVGTDARIVGDTNGDGFDDLVLGGYNASETTATERGAIWLFLGG